MVREKLVLAQESATLCPPQFSQMAVSAYLANHDWQGQIKQFREMYRERRDAMVDALHDMMPAACRWNVPDGGFYVWLSLPPGIDAKAMLPRAVTARVAYVPGTAFFADGFGSGAMRLSFCYPTPERIREGVRRLAGVIEAEMELRATFGAAAPARELGYQSYDGPSSRPELTRRRDCAVCATSPTRRSSPRPRPASGSSARRSRSSGHEHVPRSGGVLLACNHIGYVDFVYGGLAANPSGRKVRFMAKRELFDHRLTGPLMRSMHHIEVDRGEGLASFNTAVDLLRAGEAVGIFPEATISRAMELKEFKTGAVRIAAAGRRPAGAGGHVGHPADDDQGPPPGLLARQDDPAAGRRADAPDRRGPGGGDRRAAPGDVAGCSTRSIASYPADEQPPGSWWLPKRFGGTAPTLEEAAELDAEEKRQRAARRARVDVAT